MQLNILNICNVQLEEVRLILLQLNLVNVQTCHSWLATIIDEDDLCVILRDFRGKYKRKLFYDLYPDLKLLVKAFCIGKCLSKKVQFCS